MTSGDIFRAIAIELSPPPIKRESDIDRCDRLVSVIVVLQDACGIGVDPYRKIRCPFSFEHSDRGIAAAMRLYEGNRLHCFAGHGSMPPSRLYAMAKGLPRPVAASRLLELYGVERQKSWRHKAASLLNEREAAVAAKNGHTNAAAALRVYLETLPGYTEFQYSEAGHQAMAEQLSLLAQVGPSDGEGLLEWLTYAKQYVRMKLNLEGEMSHDAR